VSGAANDQEAIQEFLKLLGGKWIAAAISAAAQLGLGDALDAKPMNVTELAARLRCDQNALARLLGVLVAEGLLEIDQDDRFRTTALGAQLRSSALGSLAEFVGASFSWSPWKRLKEAVLTGKAAFEIEHGQDLFNYLATHPEASKVYDAGVDAFTRQDARALADAFDFSAITEVADVGGGMGTLLIELLRRWPHLCGTLIDKQSVVDAAELRLREAGLQARCTCVAGDFFSELPAGADIYIVRHIVHNWGDAEAIAILRNCTAALRPGGKVLVVEGVLLPGHRKDTTRLLDLEMMVLSGKGRERTKPEFRQLFRDAGLRLTKTVPLASTARLIVGEARLGRKNAGV
jgi:SAM-dependent methyltransferase/DNA-binding HxlR family transcriptional regulator